MRSPSVCGGTGPNATRTRPSAPGRALDFDWNPVCRQFISHLVPVRDTGLRGVTKLSQNLHKLGR